MSNAGKYILGAIAVIGSAIAAVLFGGFLFAIVRGSPILDIVALLVVFFLVGMFVFFLFLRSDPEGSDFIMVGAGAALGLITYPLLYVLSEDFSGKTGETIVAAVLVILAIVVLVFTYRLVRKDRFPY